LSHKNNVIYSQTPERNKMFSVKIINMLKGNKQHATIRSAVMPLPHDILIKLQ